jgi:ribosomal 50S subunit-associated protein YjgA (DUF615 family)
MMTDSRLSLVGQLIDVTDRQIQAARTLQHNALDELNALHSDLLFQLTVAMQEPLPLDQEVLDAIREKARILGRSQERLATLAGSVVSILERANPAAVAPANVYAKSGRLRAG